MQPRHFQFVNLKTNREHNKNGLTIKNKKAFYITIAVALVVLITVSIVLAVRKKKAKELAPYSEERMYTQDEIVAMNEQFRTGWANVSDGLDTETNDPYSELLTYW